MRFFFRSRQFKIIVAVFVSVVVLTAVFGILGRRMSPQTDIASTLSAPVRQTASEARKPRRRGPGHQSTSTRDRFMQDLGSSWCGRRGRCL